MQANEALWAGRCGETDPVALAGLADGQDIPPRVGESAMGLAGYSQRSRAVVRKIVGIAPEHELGGVVQAIVIRIGSDQGIGSVETAEIHE